MTLSLREPDTSEPRYVLTGGPGAGKTTILDAVAKRGYGFAPKSARRIIEVCSITGSSQRAIPPVPAREILAADIEQDRRFGSSEQPAFYDRGVLDELYMPNASVASSGQTAAGYAGCFPYNCVRFF